MNKQLIAPIAVIVAMGLKQYAGYEITDSQAEQLITLLVEIGAGIWAAFTHPKGSDMNA